MAHFYMRVPVTSESPATVQVMRGEHANAYGPGSLIEMASATVETSQDGPTSNKVSVTGPDNERWAQASNWRREGEHWEAQVTYYG